MTVFEEMRLWVTLSVKFYPGKTSGWLKENVEWMKNMSLWGIETLLDQTERKGYIRSKIDKENNEIYFATKAGIMAYKKYNPD